MARTRPRRSSGRPGKPAPKAPWASTQRAARAGRVAGEEISELEHEQSRLKAEAAASEFYKSPADHIHAVLARIDAVHAERDGALARWVELEAIAEAER